MTQRRRDLASQPHDALIKFTFSQREHAVGLLKAALAGEISAIVDWGTLRVEKIHFVDRSLRARYADLLFSMQMDGERLYIHVLLEHQSSVEPLMILRFGAYMWRHWEGVVREDPTRRTLPPILPVLIHHSDTGWTAATAFEDVVSMPAPEAARAALLPFIPRFRMRLVDVSHDPAGGLVARALTSFGRVVLFALSVAGDWDRLEAEIDRFVEELNEMHATPREIDALVALLRYLVATHPKVRAAKIVKLLETTAKKGQREVNVDVLDELKREGREEGREEGMREGMREGGRKGGARILLGLLAARFGAVPAEAKARVLGASEAMLSRWSLRVLTEPTLEAVLGGGARGKGAKGAKKRGAKGAAGAARKVGEKARKAARRAG